MNDIEELINIIKLYGGSATIDEIVKYYTNQRHIWVQAEHIAMINRTLQENPEAVKYDSDGDIWDLVDNSTTAVGNSQGFPLANKKEYMRDNNYVISEQKLKRLYDGVDGMTVKHQGNDKSKMMVIKKASQNKALVELIVLQKKYKIVVFNAQIADQLKFSQYKDEYQYYVAEFADALSIIDKVVQLSK